MYTNFLRNVLLFYSVSVLKCQVLVARPFVDIASVESGEECCLGFFWSVELIFDGVVGWSW